LKQLNNPYYPKNHPRRRKSFFLSFSLYLHSPELGLFLGVCLLLALSWGCQAESNRLDPLVLSTRLMTLLEDPDPDVRRTAALSIGKIAHPATEQALVNALKDPDPLVREYSAWAVGQLGEVVDNTTAMALVGSLSDKRLGVKMAAAQALGRVGLRQSVIELLHEAILVGKTESRYFAVEALMQLEGPSSYRVLVTALNDSNAGVRQAAVAGLGELGNVKALPALRKRLLQDRDMGVRTEAAYRLGKLGSRDDLRSLKKAMSTDPDPLVHLWSTWAINSIDPPDSSN